MIGSTTNVAAKPTKFEGGDLAAPLRTKYEGMRDRVTLDGKPAVIVGWELRWLCVRPVEDSPVRVVFSRKTVNRVLDNGGGFKS